MTSWQRGWRHLWLDASDSRRVIPADAAERLMRLIVQSEALHRGEIRICVEGGLPWTWWWPALDNERMTTQVHARALDWFSRLGVWDTEDNNGVLIYVLLAEHAIDIVADRGLNDRVPASLWQERIAHLTQAFQAGDFEAGLRDAIQAVTDLLIAHFPARSDQINRNELSDAVVLS